MRQLSILLLLAGCHSGNRFEFISLSDGGRMDAATHACDAALGCDGGEPRSPRDVIELALGLQFTCARFAAGTVKCWGSDEHGVLGHDATQMDIPDPSAIQVLEFGTDRDAVQISAGWHHVCVLFDDGRARCWGKNDSGQLGIGTTENWGDDGEETLAALPDLGINGISSISAGVSNTCAIVSADPDTPGRVHCWGSDLGGAIGDDGSGAFGDDEPINSSRPVALPANAVQVATGNNLACALLTTNAVHCWGDNWTRALGIGDTECDVGDEKACFGSNGRTPDIPVTGLDGRTLTSIEVDQSHACALDNNGTVACWGRNTHSRAGYPHLLEGEFLGTPPGSIKFDPDAVIIEVGLGIRHGCALDALGQVRCWGGAGPQLGYGMTMSDSNQAGIGGTQTPREAYAARDDRGIVQLRARDDDAPPVAVRLFSGGNSNCVLLNTGAARCWGANDRGELGYGDPDQVGSLGDDGTPAAEYRRLGLADLVFFKD